MADGRIYSGGVEECVYCFSSFVKRIMKGGRGTTALHVKVGKNSTTSRHYRQRFLFTRWRSSFLHIGLF